jgi:hypothetical protein
MKSAINKKLPIAILVLAWALVGCQSEVDKCTEAFMKANEPYKNKAERAEQESYFRYGCLKANKGN